MPETVAGVTLQPGESIQHDFRPRWGVLGLTIALAVTLLTFGLALPVVWWWRRGRPRYVVTDQRVIRSRGRLGTSTDEFQLASVSRIQTNRSLGERLLGTGSITVDTGPDALRLQRVPNHSAVAASIRAGQTG